MRWAAVSVAFVAFSCAPDAPSRDSRRETLVGIPEIVGPTSGAQLGATLAACRGDGFVAGAPGTGTAWLSVGNVMPPALGNGLGRAVTCEGVLGTPVMYAGGDAGVRKEVLGGWIGYLTSSPVRSLDRSDDTSLPVLLGSNAIVQAFEPATGLSRGLPIVDTAGFGAVVLWFPGLQNRFLVTHAGTNEVMIYDFARITGASSRQLTIPSVNLVGKFGRALAVGDFHHSPGLEVAIGAENSVYVFTQTGVRLYGIAGSDLSFGSALAVQRGVAAGLDVLWVGEPGLNRVHRFIGDEGGVIETINAPGANFGASLAIDPAGTTAIGAPGYQGVGAVFLTQFTSVLLGEAMPCVASGSTCVTSDCVMGTCVGGVFCSNGAGVPACLPLEETCNLQGGCVQEDGGVRTFDAGAGPVIGVDASVLFPIDAGPGVDASVLPPEDAGTPDASVFVDGGVFVDAGLFADAGGIIDAGVSRDAGVDSRDGGDRRDAGSRKDGGSDDAGVKDGELPLTFTTNSCSAVPALPVVLLGLALMLRRRRGHFPFRGRGMA
jgi:hypothetical protein